MTRDMIRGHDQDMIRGCDQGHDHGMLGTDVIKGRDQTGMIRVDVIKGA